MNNGGTFLSLLVIVIGIILLITGERGRGVMLIKVLGEK